MVATGMDPLTAWAWCQHWLPEPLTMGVTLWDAGGGAGLTLLEEYGDELL